jgi:DNA-binding GntR family transcriptional regulator
MSATTRRSTPTGSSAPASKRHRLADTAYEDIKRDIVQCVLEPGQQVTEELLAGRYRVGRAAVRAALKRLYQEQLIHLITPKRYKIAPITLKDVNELFDLRLLLEPTAARRAAGRINDTQRERLTALCQVHYLPHDHASARVFLSANTEFHATIAEAAGNAQLAGIIRSLLERVERVHHMSHLLYDRNAEAEREHKELLDALLAGDGDRAERLMREQILAARQFVIETMVANSSLQTVSVSFS